MFLDLLTHARERGLSVGIGEHLTLLRALELGLATDLDGLYHLGRSLYCRSETEYDAWDLAFAETFRDAVLPEDLRAQLEAWLEQALAPRGDQVGDWRHLSREELWRMLAERLREQTERHDGGNRWVGTGGTSPFGNAGRAENALRLGGEGGGRQAVNVALERRWAGYRTDHVLDVRDLKVALRALRNLARDGAFELDLDGTIAHTANNGGEIEIVEHRARKNKLEVVLLMDAGGSMAPYARRVEQLFTAASQVKQFKRFTSYSFHNCVYKWLYTDIEQLERRPTHEVLEALRPDTRLIFVGDASMAPYELFSPMTWPGEEGLSGEEWLRRLRARCPASVWLNPEPPRFWNHPTVSAIGRIFPMFELTLDGLVAAIKVLRAPV
jgi:uncharacterized protein with von Willebrand factor type A (vWA) domain